MKKSTTPDTFLSVERALIIMKYLADRKIDVGVRELSRELGYSPPVTQKILNTLKAHGFVRQDEDTDRYSLGLAALHVGQSVIARLDVVRISKPYMEQLTAETQETTFLAIRDGNHIVYVDKIPSPNAIRMDAEVGAIRPLNCTAVGKALLAWGPPELLTDAAASGAFVKATPNSITDPKVLEQELQQTRERGYALDMREFNPEGICIAAPIFSQSGCVIASITTSGLASRMEGNLERFSQLVIDAATKISTQCGYIAPD